MLRAEVGEQALQKAAGRLTRDQFQFIEKERDCRIGKRDSLEQVGRQTLH